MKKIIKISLIFILFTFISTNSFALLTPDAGGTSGNLGAKTYEEDPLFGTSKKTYEGYYDKSIKKIKEDNFKNSYTYLDKYFYVVFKYDRPLEALVERLNDNALYVPKNTTTTFSTTSTKSTTSTYEESMKTTVSTTLSSNINEKVNIKDMFSIELKISSSILTSKEVSLNINHSYNSSSSYSITTTIPPYDEDTWWYYETHARYNVYKVYTYEITYDQIVINKKTKYKKKYHSYEYYVKSLKLCEESYEYELIDSSSATGIYKYISTNKGNYKFDGDRNVNYTYLD